MVEHLFARELGRGAFCNVNLPHPPHAETDLELVDCPLDPNPLHVRYRREAMTFWFDGDYGARPREPDHDIHVCFGGRVSVTQIKLGL